MEFMLRPWRDNDAASLIRYANNPAVYRMLMDSFPAPFDGEKAQAFIARANSEAYPNILAIDIDGEASGAIGIHPQSDVYRKNAEMGYWLAEPFWGKGIMSRAIREMVNYGFRHWDITRIFARPYGSNIGSQKALENAGFVLEARMEKTFFKNGVFEDELVYAVRRNASLA